MKTCNIQAMQYTEIFQLKTKMKISFKNFDIFGIVALNSDSVYKLEREGGGGGVRF